MKIRDKLSLQFTILVAAILLLLCVMIYYVSGIQHAKEFFKELGERAQITAYIYLEEDGFPEEVYETISERYIQTIPGEIAQLYDVFNEPEYIENNELNLDDQVIEHIRENYKYPDIYEFYIADAQAVGLFYPDNQGDYVVVVAAIDQVGQTYLANLAWILTIGFSACLIIILITGRFFAKQALKPIPEIVNQVNRISASSLDVRLEEGSENDELSELVETFNELLSRLEENFSVQKRFVANASHELRTPLTSIIGEIEVSLTKRRSQEEYIEVLNSIHHEALSLHELTSGLLELTQLESEQLNLLFNSIRIDEVVLDVALQTEKKYPSVNINVSYKDGLSSKGDYFLISGNRILLYNVFSNVLDNAVKFSVDTSEKHEVDVIQFADSKRVEIHIIDYGIGISEGDLDKIFDPFFRSDDVIATKGYGIGLSFVKRVFTLLNGSIAFESQIGMGTKAKIVLIKD